MKRILIVLMALLMVFACVSCNSGISEEECEKRVKEAEQKAEEKAKQQAEEAVDEAAETFKEFIRYKYALEQIVPVLIGKLDYSTASEEGVDADVTVDDVADFYESFFGGEKTLVAIKGSDITVTKGKAYGTSTDATFKDVKFTVSKYKITNRNNNSSVVKDVTDGETLTITDGYYKQTTTGEEDNYTVTYSMGITIDGTTYSVEYTAAQNNRELTYTSASVNGKTVAPEFIIAVTRLTDYEYYQNHD